MRRGLAVDEAETELRCVDLPPWCRPCGQDVFGDNPDRSGARRDEERTLGWLETQRRWVRLGLEGCVDTR